MNKYIILLFLVSVGYTQTKIGLDTILYSKPIEYTSVTFCNPAHTSKDTIKWKLDSDFIFFIDLETKKLYSVKEIKYCVQDTMLIFVKRGKDETNH